MRYLNKTNSIYPLTLSDNDKLFTGSDLVYFSQLPWESVCQNPQHFLAHCIQNRRVFFVEKPVFEFISSWWLEVTEHDDGVWIVVPHLPNWLNHDLVTAMHQSLMDELFDRYAIVNPILWFCTPSALPFAADLQSAIVVYDRIDEWSINQDDSSTFQEQDERLLRRADVVFNTGQRLCEAKHGFLSGAQPLMAR